MSLAQLYQEQGINSGGQCVSATNANGGPFFIGQEFYTSDYISPDDWTQNDAYSLGSANRCMSGYVNGTVDDRHVRGGQRVGPGDPHRRTTRT